MSAVVKGVAGVVIPAAGAGGAYFYLKQSNQNMPSWKALKSANSSEFGKDFQPYLVDKDNEENNDWWQWSYKERYEKSNKNDLSSDFGGLENASKLKEKCQASYKENTSTLITDPSDDAKEKKVKNIWRFCSPLGGKPKTIEENSKTETKDKELLENNQDSGYKSKIGENKKTDLVSVNYEGPENEEFWKIKEKLFFGEGEDDGIGKYTSTDKKTLFNTLYDSRKDRRAGRETLKQKCGEAYKLTASGTSSSETPPKPSADDVVKYCGLKVVA